MKIVRLFVLFGIVLSVFFGCASNATNENEETVVEEVEPISQEILSEENEIAEEITEQVETEPESVQPEPRSTSLVTAPLVSPTPYSDAADAYNTGLTYLNSYDNENAEKYFLKAIEIDPNFVDAMDNLGVAYRRQGKLEQAEEIYLKSLSMRGNNSEWLYSASVFVCSQFRAFLWKFLCLLRHVLLVRASAQNRRLHIRCAES